MQANHFERLPPSIGDGSITGIGNENGRAVSRKQGKELQPRLDRGRRGEETAEVLRADGPQISQPPPRFASCSSVRIGRGLFTFSMKRPPSNSSAALTLARPRQSQTGQSPEHNRLR